MRPVFPDESGFVHGIDTRAVGLAVVALGGGRTRPQDAIDHAVGIVALAGIGDAVGATIRSASSMPATRPASRPRRRACAQAYRIGDAPPPTAR